MGQGREVSRSIRGSSSAIGCSVISGRALPGESDSESREVDRVRRKIVLVDGVEEREVPGDYIMIRKRAIRHVLKEAKAVDRYLLLNGCRFI